MYTENTNDYNEIDGLVDNIFRRNVDVYRKILDKVNEIEDFGSETVESIRFMRECDDKHEMRISCASIKRTFIIRLQNGIQVICPTENAVWFESSGMCGENNFSINAIKEFAKLMDAMRNFAFEEDGE